jgi:cysteine desulfurase family protein (TIGR01976 family)
VDPWLIAAREKSAKVRWVRLDPETMTLDQDDFERNINEKTRLVAVGLASNAVGTVNGVAAIAEMAHDVDAIVAVDAVHAAPHIPVDRDAINADIITCSAYKFFGPHVGVTVIRRELLERLDVYRLDPAPHYIPDKLETGTQNHEGIAGVKGAIDFIASLGEGTSRREKLANAMQTIEECEAGLAETFRTALQDLPGVKLYAAPDGIRKTPTIAFRVEGYSTDQVCVRMLQHGFFIAAGDFYASTIAERLGIKDSGGFVRAGLAPYNTEDEVERFVTALEVLVRGA